MISYSVLTDNNLRGETPKEKYETLVAMKNLLRIYAYPARGTKEEYLSIYDIAKQIQDIFCVEDLEIIE